MPRSNILIPDVIAENQWLIAINKPAGLIVHRDGRTAEPSLAEWIADTYPDMRGVGGAWVSPQGESVALNGLVHRLDRTTSGVVLAAKTQESFDYLKQEFKERRVEKKYLAWVCGEVAEAHGTIIAEIMRSSTPPKRWYARPCEISDVRAAITDWRVIEKKEGATLVELIPKTGRTHQIRVHLASIGHPIIADHLYASDHAPLFDLKRPALHAASIAVTLPNSVRTTYVAPEPPDFP